MVDPSVTVPMMHRHQPIPWDFERAFAPQIPRVMYPMADGGPTVQALAAASGNLVARFSRMIAPRTGILKDFSYWVGTQSGNTIAMVYDTGQADATQYTKLWDSGSVAVGGATAWHTVASPNITVIRGRHYFFGIVFDNATAAYGRGVAFGANAAGRLPANFLPDNGSSDRRMAGTLTFGSFAAPATITLAAMGGPGHTIMTIGRISDS